MTTLRRRTTVRAVLVAVILALGLFGGCAQGAPAAPADDRQSVAASASAALTVNPDGTGVSYPGVAGMTALERLQQLDPQAFASGEGENAFVTTIGGRAADDSKREYWAFYVNSELAQVGAGSYVMKDGDVITWKLETY
jgi:hypothetical protein